MEQIQQVLSYFLKYSAPELRHSSHRGTNFCITVSKKSAAWDRNQYVPEYRAEHFPRRHRLLEFRLAGRSTMTPMHWLLLGFLGDVWNTHFITGPETRCRHHGTAAEMSMLTPFFALCSWCQLLCSVHSKLCNITYSTVGGSWNMSLQLQPLQRCYCENSGSPASVCDVITVSRICGRFTQ